MEVKKLSRELYARLVVRLEMACCGCYSARTVKILARLTNSFVITAALAVIIGSLCFSVGEGLRLTPFPNSVLTRVNDAGPVVEVEQQGSGSLSKYGPLDVPAQNQKRGKRNTVDLAAGPRPQTQPVFTSFIQFQFSADTLDCLAFVAPPPSRGPPLRS